MRFLSVLEYFMVQLCFYILVWIINEYTAFLLFVIIPPIATAILLLSLIFQLIEPAKIPSSYYKYMLATILAPVFVAIVYFSLNGMDQDWMWD